MKHRIISLKQILMLFTLMILLIPGSFIIYISYRNAKKNTQILNTNYQNTEIINTKKQFESFLSTTKSMNIQISELIKTNSISLANDENFQKTLLVNLKNNPNIMSIEFASEDNESIGVARDIFDNPYGVGVSGKATDYTYNLYSINETMKLQDIVWKSENYDSRATPWYMTAKDTMQSSWTPIYLWPNGEFGIDYVSPIIVDNKLIGVVDVSTKLSYLQNFVKTTLIHPNDQVYLIEKSGNIIVGTDAETDRTMASESKNSVLKNIATNKFIKQLEKLKNNEMATELVLLDNKQYLLTISPFTDESDIDWILIKATLNDDLIASINNSTKIFLLEGLLILAISLSISHLIAGKLINPLSKLVESVNIFSKGNLDTPFDYPRKDEIGVLAGSLSNMRDSLKSQINSTKQESSLFRDALTQLNKTLIQLKDEKSKYKLLLDNSTFLKLRSESILESIGEAVFATDLKGEITLFNKVAEELTGISIDDAIGKKSNQIIKLIKESNGEVLDNYIETVIQKKIITNLDTQLLLINNTNNKIPIGIFLSPIFDLQNTVLGCVGVFYDTTKERQIDKAKTEFVSLASHQLRTPLSIINWYTELLSNGNENTAEMKKEYSSEISKASHRMVSLVDSLLNVSRLEMGGFAINPVLTSIKTLIKKCVKELVLQTSERKILISENYDNDLNKINIDNKLLAIVINNLLTNSIKYSDIGGKITITVKADKQNTMISIEDKGIGIPENNKADVFKKMYRADNAKIIDPDGSGLGLYIAYEIIEHSGGKMWFVSKENEGSTFFISLPNTGMKANKSTKTII